MLASSGGVSRIGSMKTYYSNSKQGAAPRPAQGHNYDSATFSSALAKEDASHMSLVSRLSHEVRTTNTTGDIQALRQAVASGEYKPDPMAIAGKILFLVGD